MGFFDILFGTPQSLYAAYAIIAALITICITIVFTKTDISVGNRFLFVFLVILMLIPSVFLTLFQLTCLVTGGNKNQRWWCWLYAWIVSIFIIIYCVFVIIISFMTLFTYSNAMTKVEMTENMSVMNSQNLNEYANGLMVETFANKEMEKSEVKVVDNEEKPKKKEEPKKEKFEDEEEQPIESTLSPPSERDLKASYTNDKLNIKTIGDDDEIEPFANFDKYQTFN